MKSISAAFVILIGFAWYWLGFAVRAADTPSSNLSHSPWTMFVGIVVTAVGIMGWWHALRNDGPKQ